MLIIDRLDVQHLAGVALDESSAAAIAEIADKAAAAARQLGKIFRMVRVGNRRVLPAPEGGSELRIVLDKRIVDEDCGLREVGDGFAGRFVEDLAGDDDSLLEAKVHGDRSIANRVGGIDLRGRRPSVAAVNSAAAGKWRYLSPCGIA